MGRQQVTYYRIYPDGYQTLKQKRHLRLVCNECGGPVKINDFFLLDDFRNFAGFSCRRCHEKHTQTLTKG